jgi:hypothetical protein
VFIGGGEWGMRKAGLLLASVVFLAFAAPVSAQTQGEQPGGKVSYSNPVNSLLFSSEGTYKIEVRAKTGFEHLNMNFDVNLPFSGFFVFDTLALPPCPLKFNLNGGDFWMGRLETEVTLHEKFGVFLNGEAAIPKNVGIEMQKDPFWAGIYPVSWQGSDPLWYSIETGLVYHFRPCVSFLVGFRWSPFSLDLGNPVDPIGFIQFFHSFYGDIYTSSMRTDLYIPYLGVRVYPLEKKPLKLTLLYSPIAFADVTQNFSYKFVDLPTPFVFYEHEKYSMSDFGNFVEGGIDYEIPLFRGISLGLWVKGNYMRVNGTATQSYSLTGFPLIPYTAVAQGGASLEEWTIAGGATISF